MLYLCTRFEDTFLPKLFVDRKSYNVSLQRLSAGDMRVSFFPWNGLYIMNYGKFDFSKSVKATTNMVPCTPELLHAVLDDSLVINTCDEIARHLEACQEGRISRDEFEETKNALKSDYLPVFCFHAHFADGHRSNQSAVPSGLSIYDVDHLAIDPRAYYINKVEGREEELGISFAHVSPSGEGVRLVFAIPQGMSLAEAQLWMADQLGDTEYDGCVKDLARCSYAVGRPYVLYLDEDKLFAECEVSVSQDATPSAPASVTIGTKDSPVFASLPTDGEDSVDFEESYEGVQYAQIVNALEELLGGVPAKGARNNFIYSMACNLRYVCNDDSRWIAHVLPRYGEEEQKFQSTVRSACNRPQTKTMPNVVGRALELARKQQQVKELVETTGVRAPQPPQMPQRLTRFMRLITKNVPEHLRPAVAMSVFPSLGAHCQGVKFRYNDNALVEPTFMNVLVAEMSSGKSCVNEPINAIMADIKERDAKNRRRMQEYKEEYDTCPSDAQKPERPKGLAVQWVKSDMTPAAFVQLMADAGGKFLYTRMDEIGMLNQLKTNGKGNNVTEILRLAYDCGDYGQERVGTKSVSECVEVRWNWNASTTPGKCLRFFGDSMLDGTLSRISFCTIYTDDDRMPVYGIYDSNFQEQVQDIVSPLCEVKGLIQCKKANMLVANMLEENRQYSVLADDEVYRELSYRATLSAFKRGMILYLLNGQKWSREIEDFVHWSFHYDMWCKMWVFGEKMRQAMERDKAAIVPGRRNLMDFLNTSFTLDDLNIVRRAQGMRGSGADLLRKWVQRGYCTFNIVTKQYTKSDDYLKKHPKAA